MGQLKVLGAQRIKALTEMLNEKRQEEIREVEKRRIGMSEALLKIAEQDGLGDTIAELREISKRYMQLQNELKDYGVEPFNGISVNPYRDTTNKNQERARVLADAGTTEEIAEIKARYKRKEQSLWLCETLEEAKEIVGIE